MDFAERAEQAQTTEFRRAKESVGVYRIESTELADATEVTPEGQFPEHGYWMDVTESRSGRRMFVECPGGLAAQLVDLELGFEDAFGIGKVTKDDDGGVWRYSVAALDDDDLPDDAFEEPDDAAEPVDIESLKDAM